MKTVTQIKQHFSDEEIKLLIEIIKGKQEFSVMEDSIKDFYEDDYTVLAMDGKTKGNLLLDRDIPEEEELREELLNKLEFDFEYGGLIWIKQ